MKGGGEMSEKTRYGTLLDLIQGIATGAYQLNCVKRSNDPYKKGLIIAHYDFDVIKKAPKS